MAIKLLTTPTQLRANLKRLIKASERIDVFVSAVSDPELVEQLAAAAESGTEVNLTTNLVASTSPDALRRLVDAGAHVGTCKPAVHGRRAIRYFKPGVFIFDNETDWWTAAVIGGISGTPRSLSENLEVATLAESDDFSKGNEAGELLLQVLDWGDSINHKPVDARALDRHRKAHEAAQSSAAKAGPRSGPAPRSAQVIEVKPEEVGYASPLSWQQIRRSDWGTYWNALLEADRLRGPRLKDSLCGRGGWLFGLDAAHRAYAAGPDGWTRESIRDELLGQKPASGLLGRVRSRSFVELLINDPDFRQALHETVEQCVAEPDAETMRAALTPLVSRPGVSVREVSRLLAAAAPDRFFSILGETLQLRLSSIVGFDLTVRASELQDQLTRYIDAVELTREFPWALATSAERTSDHPREPDAWSKRVALLGCLIC